MKFLIFSLFNLVSVFYSWCQKFCIQSKTKNIFKTIFFRFEYARSGNPTRKVLETCLASLDGATHAMTFASGQDSFGWLGSSKSNLQKHSSLPLLMYGFVTWQTNNVETRESLKTNILKNTYFIIRVFNVESNIDEPSQISLKVHSQLSTT